MRIIDRVIAWLDQKEDTTIVLWCIACVGIAVSCMILAMVFHRVICAACD